MKLYVGITDRDWYRQLSERPDIEEVNFWQPGGKRRFQALSPGDPFLFKLHYPDNFIVGVGMFAHFSLCPVDLAWKAFGEKNGVATLEGMRRRLAHYRKISPDPRENFTIGCIILEQPVFFPPDQWIPAPDDLKKNVVQGKTYDATIGTGLRLWEQVRERLRAGIGVRRDGVHEVPGEVWGDPRMARQRLGQGAFRVLVTDTYERRCAVTREKTLPVLEAAHILPVAARGRHRVDNGLLLRSDIHTLFDAGYVTVTPDYRFRVSDRLKRDFDNGEHYYRMAGSPIWVPKRDEDRPNRDFLRRHADETYLG